MANNINNDHCGVKAGIATVGILLYANAIVLLSESPDKLFLVVYINDILSGKYTSMQTKIVHFRKVRTKETDKV